MTVYTVNFKRMGNWKTFTAAFRNLENARKFAMQDYTDKIVTRTFKTEERAYDFVQNCCSYGYGDFF